MKTHIVLLASIAVLGVGVQGQVQAQDVYQPPLVGGVPEVGLTVLPAEVGGVASGIDPDVDHAWYMEEYYAEKAREAGVDDYDSSDRPLWMDSYDDGGDAEEDGSSSATP